MINNEYNAHIFDAHQPLQSSIINYKLMRNKTRNYHTIMKRKRSSTIDFTVIVEYCRMRLLNFIFAMIVEVYDCYIPEIQLTISLKYK